MCINRLDTETTYDEGTPLIKPQIEYFQKKPQEK